MASRGERHTAGHTTDEGAAHSRRGSVRLTVTADEGPFDGIGLATEIAQRYFVRAPRGAEIFASEPRARALEGVGAAVRVDTSKLGRTQKALLLFLFDEALRSASSAAEGAEDTSDERLLSGGAIDNGDVVPMIGGQRLEPLTRVAWSSTRATRALGRRVSPSAASQTLAKLEERGLLFRGVAPGRRRRTTSVELTQAGRRVAQELMTKVSAEKRRTR